MTACNAVLKSELKSETSFKLCSNIISGATAGLVYARNGPLQQFLAVKQFHSMTPFSIVTIHVTL